MGLEERSLSAYVPHRFACVSSHSEKRMASQNTHVSKPGGSTFGVPHSLLLLNGIVFNLVLVLWNQSWKLNFSPSGKHSERHIA